MGGKGTLMFVFQTSPLAAISQALKGKQIPLPRQIVVLSSLCLSTLEDHSPTSPRIDERQEGCGVLMKTHGA